MPVDQFKKKRTFEITGEENITINKTASNLYNILSMKKEKLYYNKRNTLGISSLIAFTANELEYETTVCKLSYSNVVGVKNLLKAEPKNESQSHDQSLTEPILEKAKKKITFDETFELYNMSDLVLLNNQTGDTVIIKSRSEYIIKPSKSEVNKELVKPSTVEIKHTDNSKEFMILKLKNILEQIICQKYGDEKDYDILCLCKWEKHVILHFDIENDIPQYFRFVFCLMGKEEKVTNKYEEFINNDDKTILICYYRSFRGLTNSSVIVVLEPSLYHQKLYVLESLSRASVVLDVIVLNMAYADKNRNSTKTFQSIINKWKSSNEKELLFDPFKFIDGIDTNTREAANLSEDMEKIRKWFAKSKSQVSNEETDLLRLNLAR